MLRGNNSPDDKTNCKSTGGRLRKFHPLKSPPGWRPGEAGAADRIKFLAVPTSNRMLKRVEIENHLFDPEILEKYCIKHDVTFDVESYKAIVTNCESDDLKKGQTFQKLAQLCGYNGRIVDLKHALAAFITPETRFYSELRDYIF